MWVKTERIHKYLDSYFIFYYLKKIYFLGGFAPGEIGELDKSFLQTPELPKVHKSFWL